MAFRVTNNQSASAFIDQINRTKISLEKTREELSSGLKVVDASDDPGRSGTIASLQTTSNRLERHQERIVFAQNYLGAQENALTSTEDILIRLKELATQAANGSISPEVRAQMADEVFQLRDGLASLANTKYQGLYIFGGLDEDDAPYDYNDSYFNPPAVGTPPERGYWEFDDGEAGQTGVRQIAISDNDVIEINTPANLIFSNALDAATRLGRALSGFPTNQLDALDADGDGNITELAAIQDVAFTFPGDEAVQVGEILASLDLLEAARVNDVQVQLSSVGARVNRLDQTNKILETLKINTDEARGAIQDTDVFKAASDFANLQTTLQGLLQSGAQINSLSLLNFI